MTMPQEALHASVARRIAAAGGPETGTAVVSVVRRFELRSWIRETCAFVARLGPGEAAAWRRSFTRTIYLAGDPARLRGRFAFRHTGADGAVAWTAPARPGAFEGLRRLLKLFPGPRALPVRPAFDVTIPPADEPGARRDLYVATAGTTVAGTMVNLGHLLAEAVLDGLIAPGDRLAVHCVPRLGGVAEPLDAVRVAVDPGGPDRLYASAGLTREAPHG